jgi:hypothetical protein
LAIWQAIDAQHVRFALGCCESGWRVQAGHERGKWTDGPRVQNAIQIWFSRCVILYTIHI